MTKESVFVLQRWMVCFLLFLSRILTFVYILSSCVSGMLMRSFPKMGASQKSWVSILNWFNFGWFGALHGSRKPRRTQQETSGFESIILGWGLTGWTIDEGGRQAVYMFSCITPLEGERMGNENGIIVRNASERFWLVWAWLIYPQFKAISHRKMMI